MNRYLLLSAAAAALACGVSRDTRPQAKAEPAYVFPHSPHVEGEVDCLECHASIAQATKLEARVRHVALPAHSDTCTGCHDAQPKLAIPARAAPFDVRFDHAAHLPRVKGKCVTCHSDLPTTGTVGRKSPPMAACTGCHNHQKDFQEARCTPCHVDLKRFSKPIEAFKHEGDFLRTHGQLARPTAETCAQFHEQSYCAQCHSPTTSPAAPQILFPEEVQRDLIHRGDFTSRHQVEAKANPTSCLRCHGTAFCDSCHTEQNISPLSTITPRDPHPAGWVTKGSGNFHGDAARRNIVTCAACHDQGTASICVGCHAVGGVGGNPHPASFISQHRNDNRTKRAVCMACHPN